MQDDVSVLLRQLVKSRLARLYIPVRRPGGLSGRNLSIHSTVPTYEFRCPSGHDFERFYKTISGAPAEIECPECGQMAGRQLSGGAGLLFKGSGFYLTDYGKNAHRASAPDKKGDSKEPAKSESSSKPESKPDSKPDSKPKADAAPAAKPAPKKPRAE